ncbi:hypothetical protein Dsin_004943 [Dipteronia sinensis]|uniref:CCHC-type domain-containing protein n=1 Tax=Dipteronia sinensis TaxID=43782 RepID=A0AAE0EE81_9ROSI|nr:hypothetical protein Dsin_004943 [Dipteronia sinensis]
MPGTSEVRHNVSADDSVNTTTWVIPGADSYSFGIGRSTTLVAEEPTSMIYKGASVRGFRRCMRPVIAVDGTHLKGRFGGTMFVATAQDGNEQVYPIAFGYSDFENNLSWEWFLDCLKGALGHIDDLVFISDQHASIEAGISKVFPYATHTICCWHFAENVKKQFHRKDVASLMDKAARAYTEFKYNRYMGELRNLHKNAFDYVEAVSPHKWSCVHCPQRRFRSSLGICYSAIFTIDIELHSHQLTDSSHLVMLQRVEKCGYMTVNPVDWNIFSVKRSGKQCTVDLARKTCTCNNSKWTIFRVLTHSQRQVPSDIAERVVLNPKTKRQSGHPMEGRHALSSERTTTQSCRRCGKSGHNSMRCSNPPLINEGLSRIVP